MLTCLGQWFVVFICAAFAVAEQVEILPAERGEHSNSVSKSEGDSISLYQPGGCLGCCEQGGNACNSGFRGDDGYCCGEVDSTPYCCPSSASQYGHAQCVSRHQSRGGGFVCYQPPNPSPAPQVPPPPPQKAPPAPAPAPQRTSTRKKSKKCSKDTGGTCHVMGCSSSRGPTQCISGGCICQTGYCALGGVCTRGCAKDTGGSCYLMGCDSDRGPTTCVDHSCKCAKGYCAVNGKCYHPSETESEAILALQNSTLSLTSKKVDLSDTKLMSALALTSVSAVAFVCGIWGLRRWSFGRFFRTPLLENA